jgi:hypothetical protein
LNSLLAMGMVAIAARSRRGRRPIGLKTASPGVRHPDDSSAPVGQTSVRRSRKLEQEARVAWVTPRLFQELSYCGVRIKANRVGEVQQLYYIDPPLPALYSRHKGLMTP